MIYLVRNNQKFGPYDNQTLLMYVNEGQVLLCNKVFDEQGNETTVRKVFKKAHLKYRRKHCGSIFSQLKNIGSELIIPKKTIISKQWIKDKKLLLLALVGLIPSFLSFLHLKGTIVFYLISLYFSIIWGLFFYYFFKTSQVTTKKTIAIFFLTQIVVFLIFDITGLASLNPFYQLIKSSFPLSLLGYVFGVGLNEELVKAIPLLIIARRTKEPLIPQTMVYYGLMSGIAFGVFEGVQYQMEVNIELEYSQAFFMNIARLTSLPFLHAVWCGIAGYFIAFAKLYPKYRKSLYFLAIAIPMTLHGL